MKTYMTPEEFVEAFSKGLAGTLAGSFKEGEPAHLEDMTASATFYCEAVFQFVAALPKEPLCKCKRSNV
jgi:hypothetical protein